MIHCLYYEMMECTKCLASRFIKPDVLAKIKHATHFLDLKYADLGNQLDDSKLSLGNSTRELLKHNKDKLSELSVKQIHSQALAFYVKAFEKVLHYLPFHTRLLEDLGFLNIELRMTADIVTAVKRVAFKLPNVISGSEVDQLMDEWKLR